MAGQDNEQWSEDSKQYRKPSLGYSQEPTEEEWAGLAIRDADTDPHDLWPKINSRFEYFWKDKKSSLGICDHKMKSTPTAVITLLVDCTVPIRSGLPPGQSPSRIPRTSDPRSDR